MFNRIRAVKRFEAVPTNWATDLLEKANLFLVQVCIKAADGKYQGENARFADHWCSIHVRCLASGQSACKEHM